MADTDKQSKSVSFSGGADVVAGDGNVSSAAKDGEKNTAESHSADAGVEEVTDMFKDLVKKKKKKPATKKEGEDDADNPTGDNADELDMSGLKKKKKKKPKAEDFESKLAEAGGDAAAGSVGEVQKPKASSEKVQEGNMDKGTGIWAHETTEQVTYNLLLDRFFSVLSDKRPELLGSITKNYKIPPPQCLREGNKKTIFANLPDIAKRLKRTEEHVTQYLFAELGTNGSVDGSRRLVIKGRFQSKQIENILRRYIQEYVSCKTCRQLNTELAKGENRLWYMTCQSCGSQRTVSAIKTGFSAQVGKRKRMQG